MVYNRPQASSNRMTDKLDFNDVLWVRIKEITHCITMAVAQPNTFNLSALEGSICSLNDVLSWCEDETYQGIRDAEEKARSSFNVKNSGIEKKWINSCRLQFRALMALMSRNNLLPATSVEEIIGDDDEENNDEDAVQTQAQERDNTADLEQDKPAQ